MSDTPSWPTGDAGETGETGADTGNPIPPPPPPPPAPAPAAPSPPPAPANADSSGATLVVRFGARLIDGLLIAAVTWALPEFGLVMAGILGALLSMAYYVGMETTQGATVGKMLLGLKVHGASGGLPSVEESAKRNIWLAFQVVPFLGGLAGFAAAIGIAVTIQSDPDNRGFHDVFAGTSVQGR